MRRIVILIGLLVFSCSLLAIRFLTAEDSSKTATGDIVYVNKKKVNIKEGPDESIYKNVEEVKYRDLLEVLELKGDWYKVKIVKSSRTGWIHKGKASKTKHERDKSKTDILSGAVHSGTSETAGAAGASGIREFNKENYKELKGNFDAVRQMESMRQKITDEEILRFMQEGKLR